MDERRAQRLGAAVLIVGILAAGAVIALDGADWRRMVRVTIALEHAGPLAEGNPVIVAGREIGRIEAISLASGPGARDASRLPGAGGVAVRVAIEARYAEKLSVNSAFFLERRGVLGRPYLAAAPPPAHIPWERALRSGDRLRGVDPARLDRVLRRLTASAMRVRAVAAELEPSWQKLEDELLRTASALRDIEPEPGAYAEVAENLAQAAAQLDALATALSPARIPDPGELRAALERAGVELAEAGADLNALRNEVERVRAQLPSVDRLSAALADARGAFADAESALAQARSLVARVEAGRGSLGAILNDPAFSQDAKRVVREILRHPWRVLGRPPER